MPDPNVIRQALRVRLQENARFIREKAERYPEQSNAEVETLEKALQPKKGARRMPD
jgi:hypothetical protein